MRVAIDLRVLELLSARLCHELVSPVGAINNGIELLGEEDPEFVRDAVELIGQSGRRAGKRLQFYRFAYGTAAGASATAGGLDPAELVDGLFEGGKVTCDWTEEARTLPPDWQKLSCNVVLLASEALPRGGTVTVRPLRAGQLGVEVVAVGETLNVTPELRAALLPNAPVDDLTSRTVQAYFTARLAEQIGARLSVASPAAGQVSFTTTAGTAVATP
jgi:histidine phosphotransferase ChpT